jgi:hypothetical protein
MLVLATEIFDKEVIIMNTGTVKFLMLKNVLVSSLAIAEVICFSIYLKFKDSPREGDKVEFEVGQGKKVLALSVLKSKETQTESGEKTPIDVRFAVSIGLLYLRRHTENRIKHQDLSCHSCNGAEAGNQYRSARAKSFSE